MRGSGGAASAVLSTGRGSGPSSGCSSVPPASMVEVRTSPASVGVGLAGSSSGMADEVIVSEPPSVGRVSVIVSASLTVSVVTSGGSGVVCGISAVIWM